MQAERHLCAPAFGRTHRIGVVYRPNMDVSDDDVGAGVHERNHLAPRVLTPPGWLMSDGEGGRGDGRHGRRVDRADWAAAAAAAAAAEPLIPITRHRKQAQLEHLSLFAYK